MSELIPILKPAPEVIQAVWLQCAAQLNPGELAACWKTGTPPPDRTPEWAERFAAARTKTLQAIEALYELAIYRPVSAEERLYRRAIFQCGPTVVNLYKAALGREPTEAECEAIRNPAAHLFPLPDGVEIPIDRAARFFADLCEDCAEAISPRDLLRLAINGLTPENTADLDPELVAGFTQQLQEVTNLITAARNGPPVLEDWLAIYELGKRYY